jgi:hypothetical protein
VDFAWGDLVIESVSFSIFHDVDHIPFFSKRTLFQRPLAKRITNKFALKGIILNNNWAKGEGRGRKRRSTQLTDILLY